MSFPVHSSGNFLPLLEGGFLSLSRYRSLHDRASLSTLDGFLLICVISLIILARRSLFVCVVVVFAFVLLRLGAYGLFPLLWLPIMRGWISLLRRLSATVLSYLFTSSAVQCPLVVFSDNIISFKPHFLSIHLSRYGTVALHKFETPTVEPVLLDENSQFFNGRCSKFVYEYHLVCSFHHVHIIFTDNYVKKHRRC